VRHRRRARRAVVLAAVVGGAALALPAAAAARPADAPDPGTLLLRLRAGARLGLHATPGGPLLARYGARTEFGSRTVLAALDHRGRWAQVSSTLLGGGRAWVRVDRRVAQRRTRWALYADVSARALTATRDGRVVRTMRVGVGAPLSPTPAGRFQVTDKLRGARYGAAYGCCILALSTDQPRPPPGWRGMARMAVHGTDVPATVGAALSAGCLHAAAEPMRWLMRRIPVGTPVVIVR
jgi:L,D-transpeptidase-like protein